MSDKRKILVSGCVYGWLCRNDAVMCPCLHPTFLKWKEEGRLIPVCPEDFGGMPTPRTESERVSAIKFMNYDGVDVSEFYLKGAAEALRLAKENNVVMGIFMDGSPSCGSTRLLDGTMTHTYKKGEGITVQLLRENGFKVFSEQEIEKAAQYLEAEEKELL